MYGIKSGKTQKTHWEEVGHSSLMDQNLMVMVPGSLVLSDTPFHS